ncbi:hypothetical protein D3C84_204830 [compost metagenome]
MLLPARAHRAEQLLEPWRVEGDQNQHVLVARVDEAVPHPAVDVSQRTRPDRKALFVHHHITAALDHQQHLLVGSVRMAGYEAARGQYLAAYNHVVGGIVLRTELEIDIATRRRLPEVVTLVRSDDQGPALLQPGTAR